VGEKVEGVKLALRAVRLLNACCKLCVNGVEYCKGGREYAPQELSEKGQTGKPLWARDGLCCVLKMEIDKGRDWSLEGK